MRAYYGGTAIPAQAWNGPEGSNRLRFSDFKTNGTWRTAFTPQKIFLVPISLRVIIIIIIHWGDSDYLRVTVPVFAF